MVTTSKPVSCALSLVQWEGTSKLVGPPPHCFWPPNLLASPYGACNGSEPPNLLVSLPIAYDRGGPPILSDSLPIVYWLPDLLAAPYGVRNSSGLPNLLASLTVIAQWGWVLHTHGYSTPIFPLCAYGVRTKWASGPVGLTLGNGQWGWVLHTHGYSTPIPLYLYRFRNSSGLPNLLASLSVTNNGVGYSTPMGTPHPFSQYLYRFVTVVGFQTCWPHYL
jgi:hypothetical protein